MEFFRKSQLTNCCTRRAQTHAREQWRVCRAWHRSSDKRRQLSAETQDEAVDCAREAFDPVGVHLRFEGTQQSVAADCREDTAPAER